VPPIETSYRNFQSHADPRADRAPDGVEDRVIGLSGARSEKRRVIPENPPDDIPAVQGLAANATHGRLYALLMVQPIPGWIATSAYRTPITMLGWFELPPIWPESRLFSEQLFSIHGLIGSAIAGLVAAHIGRALFHHFVRKDRVLMRMVSSRYRSKCVGVRSAPQDQPARACCHRSAPRD
jgi:hypothetical protein